MLKKQNVELVGMTLISNMATTVINNNNTILFIHESISTINFSMTLRIRLTNEVVFDSIFIGRFVTENDETQL